MTPPDSPTAANIAAAREQVAERVLPLAEALPPGVLVVALLQLSGPMLATHWATGALKGPLGPQLDAAHGVLRCAFDDELLRRRRAFPAPAGRA